MKARKMHPDEDQRDAVDAQRRRKALLYRAVLAAGVMVVLVVGLMLYDDEPAPVEEQTPPPLADARLEPLAPPILAPVPAVPFPGTEEVIDEYAEHADDARSDDAHVVEELPDTTVTTITAAEPATEPPPAAAPAPAPPPPTTPAPRAAPAPSAPAPAPRPPRAAAPAPPTTPAAYRVRIDDYRDRAQGAQLAADLAAAGHGVALQHRVVVGSFADRTAATDALRRLERDHNQRSLIVELAGGGYGLQLGVFAEAANADALDKRVAEWGFAVLRDVRLLLGPYPDRIAAEAVAIELVAKHGLPAVVIAPAGR